MVISKRPRAREDLVEIWEYIAEDSVNHADSFIDSIEAKLKTLAAQPLIGRARDDLAIGLRSFPIGRYILFYEAIPEGIVLIRVLHSARDVGTQFESTL